MKTISFINTDSNKELGNRVTLADTFLLRMRGLLGKTELARGEGLWIKPCKGVHTFGMNFPVDVVFLDVKLCVIAINQELLPNRMTRLYKNASSVLELPSGTVALTATTKGDRISIRQHRFDT